MISFKQYLSESINDRGILKAVFIIGLPGSGKSYTASKLNGSIQPRIVNTDIATEYLASKLGVTISPEYWDIFKDDAHRISKSRLLHYINGMLPLFVDGTSNDISNILHRIGILESVGYDVGVVFVNTSLDTALQRIHQREKDLNRTVDAEFVKAVHDINEKNAQYLKGKVSFFRQVDNDHGQLDDAALIAAYKEVLGFFDSPLQNPVGVRAIEKLKETGAGYLSPTVITTDTISKKIDGWYKN